MADFHQEVLRKYCRVCGKALAKFKVSYSCADRSDELEKTFGVAVSGDSADVHPVSFCHSCYNVLVRTRKAKEANRLYTPSVEVFSWSPHIVSSCTVCEHFRKAASGGRPKKQKIGRPSANSTRSVITHLHTIAPTSFFNTVDVCSLTVQSATSSVSISDLVCQLCSSIVDRPIQLTTCNRLVCLNCLCSSLSENGFSCPCCRDDHLRDHNTMVCPSPVVMKIIGDLLVPCDKCNKQVVTGIQKYTPLNLIIILLSNPVLSYSKLPATCGQQLHGKPGKWVFSNHHHPGGSCKVSRLPSDASGDEAHC